MGKMHSEGVTLVELMVTLAVTAIVLSFGIPTMADFIQNNRMTAAANDLVSSIHIARSEALKRRVTVVVCASSNADAAEPNCDGAADFGAGWVVFADTNANAQREADEIVVSTRTALPDVIAANSTLAGAGTPVYVAFGANGFRTDLGGIVAGVTDLQLCDERGDQVISGGLAAGRWVRVSATGHPRVYAEHGQVQGPDNPFGGCP
jgi:type IV fimbrial biogenesis protein FimT